MLSNFHYLTGSRLAGRGPAPLPARGAGPRPANAGWVGDLPHNETPSLQTAAFLNDLPRPAVAHQVQHSTILNRRSR